MSHFRVILRGRYEPDRRNGGGRGGGRDQYGRDERDSGSKRRRSPDSHYDGAKRSRGGYDGDQGDDQGYQGGGGYRGRNSHGGGQNWHQRHHHNDHHNGGNQHYGGGGQNQPQVNDDDILLTFKAWVMKQDDNINEDDACKNFKLYKTEFKKKQMQEFFVTHKDEEW